MSDPGAAWTPPAVAGPLITFRGKQIAASSLDDEANAAREAGFQRGRSEGTCGMTKRAGQTRCGAMRSRVSRSAKASATRRNSNCSR